MMFKLLFSLPLNMPRCRNAKVENRNEEKRTEEKRREGMNCRYNRLVNNKKSYGGYLGFVVGNYEWVGLGWVG